MNIRMLRAYQTTTIFVLFNDNSFSEWTKRWSWSEGVYMAGWLQQQMFLALFLLQCINLLWYYLILRLVVRLDIFLS